MKLALVVFVLVPLAAQQKPDKEDAPRATVSGTVIDITTGRPLAGYSVSTYVGANFVGDALMNASRAQQINSVTDDQGRYRLPDLPPATYRITARNAQGAIGFAGMVTRHIRVAGQDLDHIDFKMRLSGELTGKVVDENREPVVGAMVFLVSREYYSGVLGYYFKSSARTDDRGIYHMKRVDPGHAYLVMVDNAAFDLPAHSTAPLDPRLRRRALVRTFYPNSPDRQGASPVVVNPGETREGIDIEVKRAPSLCVDGTLLSLGGPAELYFAYEPAQPTFGITAGGGMIGRTAGGRTGPDGKYRICGLAPGSYRLSAFDGYRGDMINRALVPFDISDRDLHNLNLTVSRGISAFGEVVFDGPAPEKPLAAKLTVTTNPLLRSPGPGERSGAAADTLPGTFVLSGLLPGDYNVRAFPILAAGVYVKDVTYAGKSVLYAPMQVGSAAGDLGLRFVLALDGAKLSATVADKDGNPLPDFRVVVLPASVLSEAMVQAAMVDGQTDNLGHYTSQTLAPGKYLVLATDDTIDATPECIDNLWRSRRQFQEVDLAPNGTAQVSLTPVQLRR